MNYVPGIGPSNAKLMIIGEAPGKEEERLSLPFVGATGEIVNNCLLEAGIRRDDCYLTNVVKNRPPDNDLKKLFLIGKKIEDYIPQLEEEIRLLQPNCILAFGNLALKTLTGKQGIEKWRGSILQSNYGSKVVSTIHPADMMHKEGDGKLRSWSDLTFIKWDIKRAVNQSTFSEYIIPRRYLTVARNSIDVYRFFDKYQGKNLAAFDIETFRTIPICISFAFDKNEAISIPLFNVMNSENPHGISRNDLSHIWKSVSEVLYDPKILKIGQNGKFDIGQLSHPLNRTMNFGLTVNGYFFDTLLGFRTLYPELPGNLGFIASVLTEEPYWKDEGKEYNPKKDKFDRLLLYNAKDAAVDFECYEEILKELKDKKLEDYFFTQVMPLNQFYMNIESRGIKRDDFKQKYLLEKYVDQAKDLQAELDELVRPYIEYDFKGKLEIADGIKIDCLINVNSSKQVPALLFTAMKIPLRGKCDDKTLSALIRNAVKDEKKRRIIELILKIRKVRKVIGTYIEAKAHSDGRLRTSYRIMLETGRTSTSILKRPVTTEHMGLAFQTITKHGDIGSDLRSELVPDEGHVFLEVDQSGAEARVVAILSRDEKLLKMFEFNVDIHRVTKSWIDGCCPNDLLEKFFLAGAIESERLAKEINDFLKLRINSEERQIGKKGRHAANYDVGKRTFGETAGISEWRAGKVLDIIHAQASEIRGTFHKEIQEALRDNKRILVNPFGRTRQFLGKWGHDLFKEAYAQIPQSTISDQTKRAGQVIEQRDSRIQILQESHDSLLVQVPFAIVDSTVLILKEEFEKEIDFSNCTLKRGILKVPCEISIGKTSWLEMERIV